MTKVTLVPDDRLFIPSLSLSLIHTEACNSSVFIKDDTYCTENKTVNILRGISYIVPQRPRMGQITPTNVKRSLTFWPNFLSWVLCALTTTLLWGLRKVLVITFPSLYSPSPPMQCSNDSYSNSVQKVQKRLFCQIFKGCYYPTVDKRYPWHSSFWGWEMEMDS